jgi:hypothetical protein
VLKEGQMIEVSEQTADGMHVPPSAASYASRTYGQRLALGWDSFCDTVKHRKRYLFANETFEFDDRVPVSQVLKELGAVVIRRELVRSLPIGTIIFRMRARGRYEKPSNPTELGPPPVYSTVANRMSPGGVSLFYGALEENTARDETFKSNHSMSRIRRKYDYGTLAGWRATGELRVLDLARIPDVQEAFGKGWYGDEIPFLTAFRDSISRPVILDGREHVEYVPTQVISEYFRYVFVPQDGQLLDGILYPSSIRKPGTCVALFYWLRRSLSVSTGAATNRASNVLD